MLEFCTGIVPFSNLSDEDCFANINGNQNPLDYYLSNNLNHTTILDVVSELQDLLKLCFHSNFRARPSAKQLLDHPFFSDETSVNYYLTHREIK